jgi:hypothetical protein
MEGSIPVNRRTLKRPATWVTAGLWVLILLWLGTAVGAGWLLASTWSRQARPFADAAPAAARDLTIGAVFALVGVLLAGKRPRNLIGWLLLGVAVSLSLNVVLVRYAVYGILAHPGAVPGAKVAASLGASTWVVLVSALALLLLTFPHGRLPSRRWRGLVWALVVADAAVWVGGTTAPGPLTHPLGAYDNPFGVGALRTIDKVLPAAGWVIFVVFAAAAVSLVRRFRQSRGDERQQYKWFAYASVVFPVMIVGLQIGDSRFGQASRFDTIGSFVTGLTAAIIPIATAVAVMRYRLYDIDRVVSRTLVYGALSALLAGCYAGLVLGLQGAFGPLTHGNELAVACSTLAVAALFRPVRRRVQAAADRRFYRSRIDAEATLARFGARLRYEADLDTLVTELDQVVRDALQPAVISVWLRNDPETVAQ